MHTKIRWFWQKKNVNEYIFINKILFMNYLNQFILFAAKVIIAIIATVILVVLVITVTVVICKRYCNIYMSVYFYLFIISIYQFRVTVFSLKPVICHTINGRKLDKIPWFFARNVHVTNQTAWVVFPKRQLVFLLELSYICYFGYIYSYIYYAVRALPIYIDPCIISRPISTLN